MTIVQVGSNIGNTENDPIYKIVKEDDYLVLIEPNPKAKEILEKTYAHVKNKIIITCACGAKVGVQKFYIDNYIDNHVSQHSSLNKEHLIKHHHSESEITEYYTPVLRLKDILESLAITEIDYLQIDTEGNDKDIITSFPILSYKVHKLQYEISHWDGPLSNKTANDYIQFLCNHGYRVDQKNDLDVRLVYA